jgi:hypothetical protein
MSLVDRFQAYADAFEVFYENGDAKLLEPFFTEDAVYETLADPPFGARHDGRDAIFAGMAQSVSTFDKRFESRELEMLEGPEERGDSVWVRWRVTYRAADAPPVAMDGEETATFAGERIQRLEDRFDPASAKAVLEWMSTHGAKLGGGA